MGQDSDTGAPGLMIDLTFRWGCLASTGHHFDVPPPPPMSAEISASRPLLKTAFAPFHTLTLTYTHCDQVALKDLLSIRAFTESRGQMLKEGGIRKDENLLKEAELNGSEMNVNKLCT